MNTLTHSHRPSRATLGLASLGVAAATSVAALYVGVGASGAAPITPPSPVPAAPVGTEDWSGWEVRCMRVPTAHPNDNPTYCVVPKQAADNGGARPGHVR